MVPASIRRNLAALRLRERLLTFAFGAACWVALVLVALLIACLVDWLIDRDQDTPIVVRLTLSMVVAGVAGLGAIAFLAWPQCRRLSDATLALWVEDKVPEFDHRLISAVQFNLPGVDLAGMSEELVGVVTREAETRAKRVGFGQLADHRRLAWSAFVLGPALFITALPTLIWPGLMFALVLRQFLLPIDIPHSVQLESQSAAVWPIGDDIYIKYYVTGEYDEEMIGSVWVTPEGQKTERYDLKKDPEEVADGGAIFVAKVNPSSTNITFTARLSDGRPKTPSTMMLAARPVVDPDSIRAWVILPAYCDARNVKNKVRYEKQQPHGDVILDGIPGSSVHVQFEVERGDHQAWLVLLERDNAHPQSESDGPLPEKPKPGKPEREGFIAEATFDLTGELTGYLMHVKNEHGFENKTPPRRALRMVPEGPPTVTLLRDTFGLGLSASFDLEGMPVRLGKMIRVPYACEGPYGLGRAEIHYRVLKEHKSGDEPQVEEPWVRSPLPEVVGDEKAGKFDRRIGTFEHVPFDRPVPFHAIPSDRPETWMGRTQGGGLYFQSTDKLLRIVDGITQPLELKSGDKIEYCIVVYAAPRTPEASIPFGKSESRVVTVLDKTAWEAWITAVGNEDERVRQLKTRQETIFGP
jgi:hypothetical protein